MSETRSPKGKPIVLIDEWMLAKHYKLDNLMILFGVVYLHPKIPNGHHAFTSPVVDLDVRHGRIETRNSVYRLLRAASEEERLPFPWRMFMSRVSLA